MHYRHQPHVYSPTSANSLTMTTNMDIYPDTTPSLAMPLYAVTAKMKVSVTESTSVTTNDTNHDEFEKEN